MGITITPGGLRSRFYRQKVEELVGGLRKIDISGALGAEDDAGSGGVITRFAGFLARGVWKVTKFVGLTILKALSLSFTKVFSWGWNALLQLSNFDWNQSDKELENAYKNDKNALKAVWGNALGSLIGWTASVAVGYGVSFALPVIKGPQLAAYVTSAVVTEAVEEVGAAIKAALSETLRVQGRAAIRSTYINMRKMIKRHPAEFAALASFFIPGDDLDNTIKAIKNWGADKGPEWTISGATGNALNKIDEGWRSFMEALFDEAFDAFMEGGFIIANSLDSFVATQKQREAASPKRGVVVYPDRENNEERYLLTGLQTEMQIATQQIVNSHRTLSSKDVGEIAAVPIAEIVTPTTSRRTLNIYFNEYQRPPFTRAQGRGKRVVMRIPDAKPGISFDKLKRTFRPFNWGGVRATMKLNNGRQLVVHGFSETECDEVLRWMLEFTTAEPVRTVYTDVNSGVKPWQKKETTRVYAVGAKMNYTAPSQNVRGFVKESKSMKIWRDEPGLISIFE